MEEYSVEFPLTPSEGVAPCEPKKSRIKWLFGGKRFWLQAGIWLALIWYLELVFHAFFFSALSAQLVYPLLFAVPFAAVSAIVCGLFPKKVNRVLWWVWLSILCTLFAVQLIYHDVFKAFMSLSLVGMGGEAITSFWKETLIAIARNWWRLILLYLPLAASGVLMRLRVIDLQRRAWGWQGVLLGVAAVAQLIGIWCLPMFGKGDYSPYDLYYKTWVLDYNIEQLGLLTTTRLELQNMIVGVKEGDLTSGLENELPPPSSDQPTSSDPSSEVIGPTWDTSPNVLDIDFEALQQTESNKDVLALHRYFASRQGTNKNQYTGMFEGYNLITICAESFSPYFITEERTPTLYRMMNESFVFKNFYATFAENTTNGEYTMMTGLLPDMSRSKTQNSFLASKKNWWPFVFGRQFEALGCQPYAFHNYNANYYSRSTSHPNLGYIFKAKGRGLKFTQSWPTSDLEMMEQSIPFILKEDENGEIARFHAYYMTFSGHMYYNFSSNEMAVKNQALVKDLPYRKSVRAYIACNMELEFALTYLIEQLEAAGVADKTVIALSCDHFPYALDLYSEEAILPVYSELAGKDVDSTFGKYENSFILWCPSMEETVVVEEPCCSLDILPTLSNLFGLPYDSRLLAGQDILSDAMPIAVLSNQSFITEKLMYNSRTGEVTYLTDETVSADELSALVAMVKNKFTISTAILNTDYYAKVLPKS